MIKNTTIYHFFDKEYKGSNHLILFMLCFKGFSFTLLVLLINQISTRIMTNQSIDIPLFFLYIVTLIGIYYTSHYTMTQTSDITIKTVRKVRIRLIDKIRATELQFLENMGKGEIFTHINQDTDLINQGMQEVLIVIDSIIRCLLLALYIAFLSPSGFILLGSFIVILYGIFWFNYIEVQRKLYIAKTNEAIFFDLLDDLLYGFNELKLNTTKNNALFDDLREVSKQSRQLKIEAGLKSNQNTALAFFVYLMLLAVAAILIPLFTNMDSNSAVGIVTIILFIFAPLNAISRGFPFIMRLNVAIKNLEKLETTIDTFHTKQLTPNNYYHFNQIALCSVSFQYKNNRGKVLFSLPSINLIIQQGETLFITGDNGSGKSTLIKLLTGLYYPEPEPESGIYLDNQLITKQDYPAYRELFSIIFTDLHLFKKLYGLEQLDQQQVDQLLEKMLLQEKTRYIEDRFSHTDLSTGQQKRLAYINILLENKPICVLDEWAADQDPLFKKYFYEKLLKDLKRMGKTVIVVTHDDQYFMYADKILIMEKGKIISKS